MTAAHVVRSDAQANRVRLVEAAHDLFRERGLTVDVKEIAERAGVGIGTVYRNFASKDDLIAAVIHDIASEVEARILALGDVSHPGRRLAGMIDTALSVADREGALLQALQEAHDAPPDHVRELVRQVFREAQDTGAIRADIPVEVFIAQMKYQIALFLELRESLAPGVARGLVTALLLSALELRVDTVDTPAAGG